MVTGRLSQTPIGKTQAGSGSQQWIWRLVITITKVHSFFFPKYENQLVLSQISVWGGGPKSVLWPFSTSFSHFAFVFTGLVLHYHASDDVYGFCLSILNGKNRISAHCSGLTTIRKIPQMVLSLQGNNVKLIVPQSPPQNLFTAEATTEVSGFIQYIGLNFDGINENKIWHMCRVPQLPWPKHLTFWTLRVRKAAILSYLSATLIWTHNSLNSTGHKMWL